MSFGFSISDFVTCTQLAQQVYEALRTGPAKCQAFSKEVLLFYRILQKLQDNLDNADRSLSGWEQATLHEAFLRSKEFLQFDLIGDFPSARGLADFPDDEHLRDLSWHWSQGISEVPSKYSKQIATKWTAFGLRERFRAASFARNIPELQRKITALMEKLTAYNVLLIKSKQHQIHESQYRTESSQSRIESTQGRLEQSQARIEVQLKSILTSTRSQETQIISRSLDASSPEGRQTWMKLGRVLRKEGITPSMIEKNQNLLIKTLKDVLGKDASLAESFADSFQTAPEILRDSRLKNENFCPINDRFAFSGGDSASLFGSAPPSGPAFSMEFLERHPCKTSPLEQDLNIEMGMNSLLAAMSTEYPKAMNDEDDAIEAEGLSEANAAASEMEL